MPNSFCWLALFISRLTFQTRAYYVFIVDIAGFMADCNVVSIAVKIKLSLTLKLLSVQDALNFKKGPAFSFHLLNV